MNLIPIDNIKAFVSDNLFAIKVIASIGIVIISTKYLIKAVFKLRKNKKRSQYPKDVVILHQLPRGLRAPSVSPFALKLETFLRMTKIPYQNEFGFEMSSKQLFPFITYNGRDVADSQFCIEFLSKKLGIDLNAKLSDEQKAIGRAILKLTEESLRWVGVIDRFIYSRDPKVSGLPPFVYTLLYSRIKKRTYEQGYGRHSKEELYSIGKDDMKALNDIIGNKKYFLCNENCSDVDAAVFGLVCQVAYHADGILHDYYKNKCPNLVRFEKTMREEFWPDWNENVREPLNN